MQLLNESATVYNKHHIAVKMYLCRCPICQKEVWRQKTNAREIKSCIQCVPKRRRKDNDLMLISKLVGVPYSAMYYNIKKDGCTVRDFYKRIFKT